MNVFFLTQACFCHKTNSFSDKKIKTWITNCRFKKFLHPYNLFITLSGTIRKLLSLNIWLIIIMKLKTRKES